MRRSHILALAIAAVGAGVNTSTAPAGGDAITVYARGDDYSAPAVPSRGKARPSAHANSAAKKRRRRRSRGW